MKTTALTLMIGISLFAAAPASAQVCEQDDLQSALQYLRRLSLDLRGRLPEVAELESVVTNRAIDPAIIAAIVRSEDAVAQLRVHHRDLLWMNVGDVRLGNQAWTLQLGRNGTPTTDTYFLGGAARANTYRGGAPGGCLDEPARFGADGSILTTPDPTNAAYRREGWVMVRPYWNPSVEVKVCAFDAQTAATAMANGRTVNCYQQLAPGCGCGPNLNWCQSGPDRTIQMITASMSEQLLRYIDRIIRDGRPYTEIVNGTSIDVNGPLSHYFRYQTANAPNIVFVTPNQSFMMPEIPFSEVDTWTTVNRNGRHAGVLSMPGYLLKFQSNRGRANRFYNAFLCQYFSPPAGGLPAASDDCHNEPDLTKRCGCQYCHQSVEPAAAFWGRWAEAGVAPLGETQFPSYRAECEATGAERNPICRRFYLTTPGHPDEQRYKGWLLSYVFADQERQDNIDQGPGGIAEDAIQSGAFAQCAVQRLWERLVAREADEGDQAALAELTTAFARDYDYRKLVESIVTRPEYSKAGRYDGRED
jgi:hypothetical protein